MFGMLLILVCCGASTAARADSCPGNPDALGTERVLAVDTALSAGLAANNFQTPCRWRRKEIVLTFDDGPWPSTTPAVLDALKDECVPATFFLLGRNAIANPELARRERDEGPGHYRSELGGLRPGRRDPRRAVFPVPGFRVLKRSTASTLAGL
jgi:peptidoglycan/xylan/chitin deacetylase (PgdA/CDA1 family)